MPKIPLIALEIVLGFGVPLAWGVWQLISLRREKARDAAKEAARAASQAETDSPSPARHPERQQQAHPARIEARQ